MVNCEEIRASIVTYLQQETEILSTPRACIVSLPIKILDGINVEIFIEEVLGGYRIHDGGKSVGNLESSGLVISERRLDAFSQVAQRMGAVFQDGIFYSFAREGAFQDAIFSVAQCCSAASMQLIRHSASAEEDRIRLRVSAEIKRWAAGRDVTIFASRKLPGRVKQYTLDFVAESSHATVGMNILLPSYNSTVSAERYALQVIDLGKVGYKRLAILAKPNLWKKPARQILNKMADAIAEFDEQEGFFTGDNNVGETLSRLTAA